MLDKILRDYKYAIRSLSRRPLYFVVAVLILALGTGVNSTVFHLANAMLLRPLAVPDSHRLVRVKEKTGDTTRNLVSYPDYLDYQAKTEVLDGLVATNLTGVSLQDHGQILGEVVSGNYYTVLGIRPILGRAFTENESGRPVVLSERAWRRYFNADPAILGREIILNAEAFPVLGVVDGDFNGTFAGASIDVWVRVSDVSWLGADVLRERDRGSVHLIGRLAPSVSSDQARAALAAVASQLESAYPRTTSPRAGVDVMPATLLHGNLRKGASIFLGFLLGIAGLVLLAACANLANLTLMRSAGRRREFAIRSALGAGSPALIRQFLAEGIVTALAGGAVGLLLAGWVAGALLRFNPIPSLPLSFQFDLDWRVAAFQFGIALLSGVALGLLPALHLLRTDLLPSLKEESTGFTAGPQRSRLRRGLVVLQIAVSVVLLVTAGLFFRSLLHVKAMDPGFDFRTTLAMDIDLNPRGHSPERGAAYYAALLNRVAVLPGVESCSLVDLAPLDIATPRIRVIDPSGAEQNVSMNVAGTEYFRTLGIALLSGRDFTDADASMNQPVAVINETMAHRYWPGRDPVGRTIRIADAPAPVTVVGVARDVRYRSLGGDPEPHLYLPFRQSYQTGMTLVVRAKTDPAAILGRVQQEVAALDPAVQAFFARTMEQHMGFSLLPARLASTLSGVLGLITLIIAALGIYGSVGYSVSMRTREIGIRMALGANSRKLLADELKRNLILTLVSLGAGLGVSLGVSRAASGLLHGVGAADPLTFTVVPLLLLSVATLAVFLPVRRAVAINPLTALHHE